MCRDATATATTALGAEVSRGVASLTPGVCMDETGGFVSAGSVYVSRFSGTLKTDALPRVFFFSFSFPFLACIFFDRLSLKVALPRQSNAKLQGEKREFTTRATREASF